MCTSILLPAAALALAPALVRADGLHPGSVLIYPVHHSGTTSLWQSKGAYNGPFFTVVSVSNTNLLPVTPLNGLGGATNVHFEFVNASTSPSDPEQVVGCSVDDQVHFLTPGDTLALLTGCANPPLGQQGYVVLSAQDPNGFGTAWAHDWLVGSELVFNGFLGYAVNAIPLEAGVPAGHPTDVDGDGQLDFDGIEYEPVADEIYLELVVDSFQQSIALINLSGGTAFTATLTLDIWNDNEKPLSTTFAFRCWTERLLSDVTQIFTPGFLAANTQNDPGEIDADCDGVDDHEAAWVRVRGLTASSPVESFPNPAVLVAHTRNSIAAGGRRAWESQAKQTNGDFLKTGTDDPEFP